MKKILFPLIMVTILCLAALDIFGQEQAPAPTFQEGDFWQFKATQKDFPTVSSEDLDGTYELSYSQGEIKGFVLTGDKKEEIQLRADLPSDYLLVLLGSSTQRQDLKFPLSVGQKWNYDYRYREAGAKNGTLRHAEVRVVGAEQVSTAAGSFNAFKIEKIENYVTGGGRKNPTQIHNVPTTYFYSPQTKSVIKSSSGNKSRGKIEIELIKFGTAR